ncbi:hypothetical protein HNY73_018201 [Argiope bruennichi]|uniref:Uncharacterized protein n=1 Tax=Argiope bruennichi TaxID=94029 RepID=A0A8T0EG65_ARGBR|nr:hypothetical protein HNY73_018201 [Argiope bruennichi]
MRGSWLLMFCVIQTGSLFRFLDGSLHGWIESDEPTCEELRSFWNTLNRSVKMSEFTNEIPLIPWEVFSYINNHSQKSGKKKFLRTANPMQNVFTLNGAFAKPHLARPNPDIGQEPFQVLKPSPNQDVAGIIGSNFHEPSQKLIGWEMSNSIFSPTTAQSGAKKKGGGGNVVHSPSWGMPEEVGTFGRFVDFDEAVPVLTRKQDVKQYSGGWSEPLLPSPSYELYAIGDPCLQIVNKYCMADEQCTCAGRDVLRCHHGKCISYHTNRVGGVGVS